MSKTIWTKIIKSNAQESKDTIDMMKEFDNDDNYEKPQVGIFWYKPENKELFLVKTIDYDLGSKPNNQGDSTYNKLHKQIWQKEFYHGRVNGDYKNVPRGRVFYNINDNYFKIKVGSWFNDLDENDKNKLINDIKYDFNLQNENVQIIQDEHWDIGNGFKL